jgi:hypothetical protein
MDTSKWHIVASSCYNPDIYVIDTGVPNLDIKGDTMCRILDIKTNKITKPRSLGQLLKQGWWDECEPDEAPNAGAIAAGAREVEVHLGIHTRE